VAYRWLLAQGYKPNKIVISGDSAGGGLTLAGLLALRDAKTPMPAAAVPISAWSDMEGTGASVRTRASKDPMVTMDALLKMARNYVGNTDPKNPLASPLYGVYRGIPPMLMQVGDAEILLDDSTRVAEKAKAAGVKVDLEVWDDMTPRSEVSRSRSSWHRAYSHSEWTTRRPGPRGLLGRRHLLGLFAARSCAQPGLSMG